jgi:periplasmic protein TonB
MSSFAVNYSSAYARSTRRTYARRGGAARPVRALRPWAEVAIVDVPLQATSRHPPHISRPQLIALIIVALTLHTALAWYLSHRIDTRHFVPTPQELNIEIVRPPKPPEPPKIEPPKPQPVKPHVQPAQVLPQIQQNDPLPSSVEETEQPSAVAPIIAPPPPAAPESVTPPIGRAGYLNNPPPEYPAQAVRQGWQGTVLLRVHVLSDGKVDIVEVKQGSGRKILDDEAIRTVKRWLFTPSKRGDTPIDGFATVPIEFSLDQ